MSSTTAARREEDENNKFFSPTEPYATNGTGSASAPTAPDAAPADAAKTPAPIRAAHPPLGGPVWYIPTMFSADETREPEWRWGAGFDRDSLVCQLRLRGRCVAFHAPSTLVRLLSLALIWAASFVVLPAPLASPGGYVFDLSFTISVAALVGGTICAFFRVPALAGILWIAVVWGNVPRFAYLTEGIDLDTRGIVSKAGLALILLRAGLSIKVKAMRQEAVFIALLSLLPLTLEAVTHALIAHELFSYPDYKWSFLQGFVGAAVAPAVVIPGVLLLRSEGYVTEQRGPLSLLLSSVTFDTVASVWAINFLIDLIFGDPNRSAGVNIALGPLQVLCGLVVGVILGLSIHFAAKLMRLHDVAHLRTEAQLRSLSRVHEVVEGTDEPLATEPTVSPGRPHHSHTFHERSRKIAVDLPVFSQTGAHLLALLFCLEGFAVVFLGFKYELSSGGAIATTTMAATLSHLWVDKRGALKAQLVLLQRTTTALWDDIVMPALFAASGSSVSLSRVFDGAFFWKAITCLGVGAVVRFVVAFLCMSASGFTLGQRVVASVAWLGKASVQGALGNAAHLQAQEAIARKGLTNTTLAELEYSDNVQNIAMLGIIIFAPLAAISLLVWGRDVFEKEEEEKNKDR